MTDLCSICISNYTQQQRAKVPCMACDVNVCSVCVRKYLLEIDDPACMNCRTLWNREFLDEYLPKSFLDGDYAKHKREVLLLREKQLLPRTMHVVEREKQKRGLLVQADEMNVEIKRMKQELKDAMDKHMDIMDTAR